MEPNVVVDSGRKRKTDETEKKLPKNTSKKQTNNNPVNQRKRLTKTRKKQTSRSPCSSNSSEENYYSEPNSDQPNRYRFYTKFYSSMESSITGTTSNSEKESFDSVSTTSISLFSSGIDVSRKSKFDTSSLSSENYEPSAKRCRLTEKILPDLVDKMTINQDSSSSSNKQSLMAANIHFNSPSKQYRQKSPISLPTKNRCSPRSTSKSRSNNINNNIISSKLQPQIESPKP